MKKIAIKTDCKRLLADVYTPVGIYLRLRDRFRDTILLESTDNRAAENSYSFICINAIAGMEISSTKSIEFKYPGQKPERTEIKDVAAVPGIIWNFMKDFAAEKPTIKEGTYAQGLFGYATYDAIQFFETIKLKSGVKAALRQAQGEAVPANALSAIPVRYCIQSF
ncbi:MAG: hypothetical protein QM764_02670 [Chitinophagaceae bacterium]